MFTRSLGKPAGASFEVLSLDQGHRAWEVNMFPQNVLEVQRTLAHIGAHFGEHHLLKSIDRSIHLVYFKMQRRFELPQIHTIISSLIKLGFLPFDGCLGFLQQCLVINDHVIFADLIIILPRPALGIICHQKISLR